MSGRLLASRLAPVICRRTAATGSQGKEPVPATKNTERMLEPADITPKNAVYDDVTHTGQAWDQADVRLARFELSKKQVNPNFAQNLIAELPPVATEERVMHCDGGHPALGHPRVFINLDKPGTHACGYCGQRFYNTHVTKGSDIGHPEKTHINV